MQKTYPIQLNDRIHLIDGFDLGVAERTGTYVIAEEEIAIVDTGTSHSVKHVIEGLETLGYSLDQVKYIIVTHIHLDHAGGAGYLLKQCINAKVVVHPRGARHLSEPERLVAGAKVVYGETFDNYIGPVYAIPEEKLLVKNDGDTLKLSATCTLQFSDTPGHSNHHLSIYDPISNGMFSGDTVGIRYEQLIQEGVDLYLPSTSPNQFNPDAMQAAIDTMLEMNLDYLYFGHFGMTKEPEKALQQVSKWLTIFNEETKKVADNEEDYEVLANRLVERIREDLRKQGVSDNHEVYFLIELDMEVSAMGLMDYMSRITVEK